jgi:hypothetical protein
MQISTSKKTTAITATIILLSSFVLMVMPIQAIDYTEFQDHYDPAIHGVYPQYDPDSPNIPAAALITAGLPAGAVPDYTFDSIAYLSFRPNPIGVGQSLLVNMWTSPGLYHAFYAKDYKITIENPDGETQTVLMDSYCGDATMWFEFTPDQVGTWRLKFESPGLFLPKGMYEDHPLGSGFFGAANNTYNLYASIYYTACETEWQELTVQENLVFSWPPSDLPTDYWTRPANPVNREWWSILGNYPWTGTVYYMDRNLYSNPRYGYTAYIEAPNSAHVVWKRQGALGGLIGGEEYYISERSGGGTPSIIFWGRAYQGITKVFDGKVQNILQCYDIRTGEIYWEQPAASFTRYWFGMAMQSTLVPTNILYERSTSEAVPGAVASRGTSIYLVAVSGGRLYKWDPWTGALSQNISLSVTDATIVKNDEVLSVQNLGDGEYRLINWTMRGSSSNFESRVLSNITWPSSSLGDGYDLESGIAFSAWWNTPPGPQWCVGYMLQTIDLFTGEVLVDQSSNDTLYTGSQNAQTWVADRGKIAVGCHGQHFTCFDVRTGELEWYSELSDYPWGSWWPYNIASYDFNETKGAIIANTYEGIYAFDWDDGSIIWHYQDPKGVPFENPYVTEEGAPSTPYFTGVKIADGKVYAYNGEHTASQPAARDWKLHCINATTGELVWQITNPMTPGAMADGYLTASNPYDGYMYVFGKGKSATTVTAAPKTIAKGAPVLIEGTVLDQSPAQPDTPCVSKESMQTQMEYLHIQLPIDGIWHNETITGVPLYLTAIDSDNNVYDLGTVTSNGYYGTFGYEWTPSEEGLYEIIASFMGDDSYGSSVASTFVSVGPAPSPAGPIEPEPTEPEPTEPEPTEPEPTEPEPTEPEPTEPTEAPFITTEIAIILAVVIASIIGIAAYWTLRKQK